MKVILATAAVHPFHGHGGVEKYPYYLGKYLLKEGIEVKIVSSTDYQGGRRTEFYNGLQYDLIPPMVYLRKITGPWSIMYNYSLNKYLHKSSFDILHSFSTTAYAYLHFKEKPVIVQPFGLELFTAPSITNANWFKRCYIDIMGKRRWKYCIKNADLIASEGDFQNDDICRIFSVQKEKISMLPVGIDIDYIQNKVKETKVSRSHIGVDKNDLVLLSVNRFIPDKGLIYLVEAFKQISMEINAKLILIGRVKSDFEKDYYEEVMTLIKKYDLESRTIVLTNVPEDALYEFYALADVYVSPTLHDDFIMSIQEAMAVGLPIVSTGQKILVHEGKNGFVVPKRDPNSIASAIQKLYNETLRTKMKVESQKIVKNYDFAEIAKSAVKLYEELISTNKHC